MSRVGTTVTRIAALAGLVALLPPAVATVPRGPAFTIDAAPIGLGPGHVARLDLRLRNRRAVPVDVRDVTVRIADVRAPSSDAARRCTARDFEITQLRSDGSMHLPPLSTRRLSTLGVPGARWPRLAMAPRRADQGGCAHASLTLAFSGTARAVGR
jgi:hypothetical protein